MNNAELEMMRIYAIDGPSPIYISPLRMVFRRNDNLPAVHLSVSDFLRNPDPQETGMAQTNFGHLRYHVSGRPPIEKLIGKFYAEADALRGIK